MDNPRVREYEWIYDCRLIGLMAIGVGQDGFVMRSDRLTAVKFFDRHDRFDRECEVYRVLTTKSIRKIAGHNVPKLIAVDQSILTIEMSIVRRPFLLDFAGCKHPWEVPDFDEDVMAVHYERLQELFGDR